MHTETEATIRPLLVTKTLRGQQSQQFAMKKSRKGRVENELQVHVTFFNDSKKPPALQELTNRETTSSSSQQKPHISNRPKSSQNRPTPIPKTQQSHPIPTRTEETTLGIEHEESGAAVEGVNGVTSRLEKLRLNAEEPELSEEQLRINDQLQDDELLALEAIYGDNLTIFKREGGQLSFQIHIHIETPDEVTISAELHSSTKNARFGGTSTSLLATTDSSNGVSSNFKVQHLPPLVLKCLLPKSYPSHCLPNFTISVQWLDSMRISNLCSMLDCLWTDQPGQEVIFHWVEWLHTSSLSYLGIDKEIILDPYNIPDTIDSRADSENLLPDVVIPSMINYNDVKCRKVFLENLHECCICLSEYAGTSFVRLPCKHFFCWKCMETYSSIHVKEGTVNKLLCPETKCGGAVPPSFLKLLLGHEEFERWESLLLQKTLDSMSDVKYCPRCTTACIEDGDCNAQCPKCFFSFCCICHERRHVGVNCVPPEIKLQVLQEAQESAQISEDQKRINQEMINEILTLQEIHRDSKQCPRCNTAISRIEGCNQMACHNCGQYFCYQCNKPIKGHDHFSSKGCTVFADSKVQEKERQENAKMTQLHPCPICAQENAKVGSNNSIVCRTCQNRYCYLCRMSFRHSNQHFTDNDSGCSQYTVG